MAYSLARSSFNLRDPDSIPGSAGQRKLNDTGNFCKLGAWLGMQRYHHWHQTKGITLVAAVDPQYDNSRGVRGHRQKNKELIAYNAKYGLKIKENKSVLEPRVSPAFVITYLCNHCNRPIRLR